MSSADSLPAETAPADWRVPAIIGAALMMQTLNATVLTNALPAMATALEVDPLRLNLAITMYMLAAAVFLPVSGWAADRFGARSAGWSCCAPPPSRSSSAPSPS